MTVQHTTVSLAPLLDTNTHNLLAYATVSLAPLLHTMTPVPGRQAATTPVVG